MAAQRAWTWDYEEMKIAGTSLDDDGGTFATQYDLKIANTSPEPLPISGFTPINQARHSPGAEGPHDGSRLGFQSGKSGKPIPPKRRKTQSSATLSATKPRKVSAPRKARKSKTAGDLQCRDISTDLPRKKSMAAGLGMEPVKTVSPADLTLLEQRPVEELLHDALVAFEAQDEEAIFIEQDQPTGRSNKYPAVCPKPHLKKPRGQVPALADQLLANEYLTMNNEDVACENGALSEENAVLDNEGFIRAGPWIEDSEGIPPELLPPPSAQGEIVTGLPDISPFQHRCGLGTPSETRADVDGKGYNGEDVDEFPLDETDADAMVQSEISFAAVDEYGNGCRLQDLCNGESEESAPMINPAFGRDMDSLPQLPSSQQPCILTHVAGNITKIKHKNVKAAEGSENCFDDDDLDDELMYLPREGSDNHQPSTPLTSPEKPSTPKLQWLPPKVYIPAKSSQIPVSPTDIPHLVPFNINGEPLPFTRPSFPKPIRDRSPILGLTNRAVLRTCFRIGEALNAAAVASRTNTDAVIELYGRVIHSERETEKGYKQFLQFGDLFTDKPPYLSATYSLWKGVGLWDMDSKVFLGEEGGGKMARVLGRIKKREQGGGCEMVVLSIWEVDWEDVGVAKGIVCS